MIRVRVKVKVKVRVRVTTAACRMRAEHLTVSSSLSCGHALGLTPSVTLGLTLA